MSMPEFFDISTWLSLGLVFCLILIFGLVRSPRAGDSQPRQKDVYEIKEQLKILCSSELGMAKRLDRMAKDLNQLQMRLTEQEVHGSENIPYAQAIRMAERGTDVDGLIENFGLNRGEAELLKKLHQDLSDEVASYRRPRH